ncbi:MAG: gliding motility-associated C-terminal domain-containing protein, partial [Bacteroidia bacterium]|nr:gliding motility-associated C-terminal domain-containing protein [Bacteroidia bacterium]
ITIWDRWGLQMWEGTGLTPDAVTGFFNTWEGKTTSGKECPDGTYYYMLKAYKFDGDIVEDKGFISLVR